MFVCVDPHRWVHHLPFRCFYFRNFDAFLGGGMGQHLYCKSLRTKKLTQKRHIYGQMWAQKLSHVSRKLMQNMCVNSSICGELSGDDLHSLKSAWHRTRIDVEESKLALALYTYWRRSCLTLHLCPKAVAMRKGSHVLWQAHRAFKAPPSQGRGCTFEFVGASCLPTIRGPQQISRAKFAYVFPEALRRPGAQHAFERKVSVVLVLPFRIAARGSISFESCTTVQWCFHNRSLGVCLHPFVTRNLVAENQKVICKSFAMAGCIVTNVTPSSMMGRMKSKSLADLHHHVSSWVASVISVIILKAILTIMSQAESNIM